MANSTLTISDLNDEKFQKLLAPIVFLVITLTIGVPGNLTVLVIYGKKYAKSVHRTIVWNLAVADQVFCSIGIPFNIARIVHYYSFEGEWACVVFVVMLYFLLLYSTHLLVLLSIHRFRKICFPLRKQISVDNVNYWVIGCFAIAFILSAPHFGLSKYEEINVGYNLTGYSCAISLSNPSIYSTAFSYGFLSLFVFYTIVLIVIYSIIGRKLYIQHKRRLENHVTSSTQKAISSKMTKIAFAISMVFAVSYIPLFILQITEKTIDEDNLNTFQFAMLRIGERLYVVNHVANPFIYGLFDKRFKKHLKGLLTCNWRRNETKGSTRESTSETTL
ncbi:type-1 angiotensin II receptor A-like [Mytilus trossulus]|uniref:type-1 angiotensin II receptor A-like n=1 Tax=Mytilus trossulus TaxID=6551 RepID=UPI003006FD89